MRQKKGVLFLTGFTFPSGLSHMRGQSSSVGLIGVGLVIRGSLVQFPTGALWSVLGQDGLFLIASVYPAVKWVPTINEAVLRACALYAASCSGISPGGLKWCPCVQACWGMKVV